MAPRRHNAFVTSGEAQSESEGEEKPHQSDHAYDIRHPFAPTCSRQPLARSPIAADCDLVAASPDNGSVSRADFHYLTVIDILPGSTPADTVCGFQR